MEIYDIVTEKEMKDEWLQFAGTEKEFIAYIRNGEVFLFKKVKRDKYQLRGIYAREPNFVAAI